MLCAVHCLFAATQAQTTACLPPMIMPPIMQRAWRRKWQHKIVQRRISLPPDPWSKSVDRQAIRPAPDEKSLACGSGMCVRES